jgi:hypothetical protein
MFKAVSTNAKLLTSCLQSILIKKDAVSQHISAALVQVLLLAALILLQKSFLLLFTFDCAIT